jgi:hypothetical protein
MQENGGQQWPPFSTTLAEARSITQEWNDRWLIQGKDIKTK